MNDIQNKPQDAKAAVVNAPKQTSEKVVAPVIAPKDAPVVKTEVK
jgi:hypothetical protein